MPARTPAPPDLLKHAKRPSYTLVLDDLDGDACHLFEEIIGLCASRNIRARVEGVRFDGTPTTFEGELVRTRFHYESGRIGIEVAHVDPEALSERTGDISAVYLGEEGSRIDLILDA